jgi:hypothetical protein
MQCSDDDEQTESSPFRLIFVGGSHAARMASAADRLGLDFLDLSTPGFRITPDMVSNSCDMLQDAMSDETVRSIIVYHLLDNNVFF